VSKAEALKTCREILGGVHDDLPPEAFYLVVREELMRSVF